MAGVWVSSLDAVLPLLEKPGDSSFHSPASWPKALHTQTKQNEPQNARYALDGCEDETVNIQKVLAGVTHDATYLQLVETYSYELDTRLS